MSFLLGILAVLICGLFLGYIFIEFLEGNSEEPKVRRKWSDPKFKDE